MIAELLARLADIVLEQIPSDRSRFLVVDGEGNKLLEKEGGDAAATGDPDPVEALIRETRESGRPVIIPDPDASGASARPPGNGRGPALSALCLPLRVMGRAAGFACLARNAPAPPLTRADLEFLALALSPALYVMSGNRNPARSGAGPPSAGTGRGDGPFVGTAPSILRVRSMIDRLKDSDAPVFIWGESGTGKELAARSIHEAGRRRAGQFVAVNCGAIPENLLESELFGHARGSFTGALRDKPGLVEEAHAGTFFLDEVGDLPMPLQAKLLRVLEEKKIRRVGETRPRPVDVRFVSATNKNLEREIEAGRFREDLYYRLKIVSLELPALRERAEDIPPLVNHFLDEFSKSMGRSRPFFSPPALELMLEYPWPGNVRELQSEVQRCLIMTGDGQVIGEEALSPIINPRGKRHSQGSRGFLAAKAEFERRFLREALARCGYHRTRTAAEIGLTRQGLFKLLKKHNIPGDDERSAP